MKFLHTADLHIGKVVNGFSMLEDQRIILKEMLAAALEKAADAVVMAGDIYDRSIPPAEAVGVLDEFLTGCHENGIKVLLIAGNHDSPERLSFAERLLQKQDVFLAGSHRLPLRRIALRDAYGEVEFILLPFFKPSAEGFRSSMEAVKSVLHKEGLLPEETDGGVRRVLATHFFVTDAGKGPELSDSEYGVHVGGIDHVDAGLFAGFSYVALGHIHKPQQIGNTNCYYAGSPLKYSFSECRHRKGVNLVEVGADGSVRVEAVPLLPKHDMRVIRGRLKELIRPETAALEDREDYIQACLTDEEELIDPIGALRSVYPNIMQLHFTKNEGILQPESTAYQVKAREKRTALELFRDFYEVVKEEQIDENRLRIAEEAMKAAEADDI